MKKIHNLNESICELNYSFDYNNLVRFKNEDSLKAKYGEQFFNTFFQEFTESWCSILGETLQHVDYLELVQRSIIEASKKVDVTFTAPEDADAIYHEWCDYDELREVAIDEGKEIEEPSLKEKPRVYKQSCWSRNATESYELAYKGSEEVSRL